MSTLSATTPYCETWSDWSDCSSQNCEQGQRTRQRKCPDVKTEDEPCIGENVNCKKTKHLNFSLKEMKDTFV